MPLELVELKERLEKRPKKGELARAISYEERVKFHVLPSLNTKEFSKGRNDFLNWCKGLLSKDAYPSFEQMVRPPYPTVSLYDRVFAALSKVLDGKDATIKYQFASETAEEDWSTYQAEVLDEPQRFKALAFEKLRSEVNSMLIVDMDSEAESPEPYYYFLSVSSIIDYEDIDGVVQWVMFKESDDRLIVLDDSSYRVFITEDKTNIIKSEEVNNPHDLGYCPAMWFWTDRVRPGDNVKRHPITSFLADSDLFLFQKLSKSYLDTYASTPIFWGYDSECEYEYEGQRCEGGMLYDQEGLVAIHGHPKPCPKCRDRKLGAGTFITVPQPDNDQMDGTPDMRDPVGVIEIPVAGLNYNVEEVERRERAIYEGITGYGGDAVKTQAINIEQVLASIDSRRSVLINLKKNFEKAHQWMVSTVCRLRYGQGFTFAYVNYGTQFYFFEPEQILEMYEAAKEKEVDDIILDQLQDEYFDAKFRASPEARMRTNILVNLDPFRHRTRAEVAAMLVKEDEKLLKLNFSSIIRRFERENADLLTFGSALEFDKKIGRIKEVLMTYVSELKVEANVL